MAKLKITLIPMGRLIYGEELFYTASVLFAVRTQVATTKPSVTVQVTFLEFNDEKPTNVTLHSSEEKDNEDATDLLLCAFDELAQHWSKKSAELWRKALTICPGENGHANYTFIGFDKEAM